MRKLIVLWYLLSIPLTFHSCTLQDSSGNDDKETYFNNHQEVLNQFVNIIRPEYLVLETGSMLRYESENTKKGVTKRIELEILKKDEYRRIDASYRYKGNLDFIQEIADNKSKLLEQFEIDFHLPYDKEITLENIIQFNKHDDDKGFIFSGKQKYGYIHIGIDYLESGNCFFGINVQKMNGVGKLLKLDGKHDRGGYFIGELLNDTIAFVEIRGNEFNGRYFSKNIVESRGYSHEREGVSPELYNGHIVKYIEEEGEYIDGNKVGRHVIRDNGIVQSEYLYDNSGQWLRRKEFYNGRNLYFQIDNGLVVNDYAIENHFGINGINYLWSNQEKFTVEENKRGYKSYTPFLFLEENRKKVYVEGRDEELYVRHGKYVKYEFIPDTPYSDTGSIKPTVQVNYLNGYIDGNVVLLDKDSGLESFNGNFIEGDFIGGTFTSYYDTGDKIYVGRTGLVNENGVSWTDFNELGDTLDKGFRKVVPNEWFYSEAGGVGLVDRMPDFEYSFRPITKIPPSVE